MANKLHINGRLLLHLNRAPIDLEGRGDSIHITFSTIRSLKNFYLFFRGWLSREPRLIQWIEELERFTPVYYYFAGELIAESGPQVSYQESSRTLGLRQTKLYKGKLFKSLFKGLFQVST